MRTNVVDFTLADQLQDAENRKRARPPPKTGVPIIRVEPGEMARVVDEAEQALIAAGGVYQFGATIVNVVWGDIRVAGGLTERALRHPMVTPAYIIDCLSRVACFEKYSKLAKDYIVCDCPSQVGHAMLSRGTWNFPSLLGVVTAPTLRADGSILDTPGYDEASGLIYNSLGVDFPTIPDRPTKEDAAKALRYLKNPLKYYKFTQDVDRAVALSGILTALLRPSIPTAPMHAVDAPAAASGKSALVDVASIIATGHAAAVTSTGGNMVEFEKRLSASVLGGDTIVNIDNIAEPLDSVLLCQLLTQSLVSVRIFGKLDNVIVPAASAFYATGNNITIVADLTRRVLTSRIDTKKEKPELERYPFEPTKFARRFRVRLVLAALTLVRAYIVSGERVKVSPLGSYEEWSRLIREPLIWLGEEDPVEVLERSRQADPRLQHLTDIISSWAGIIGVNHQSMFTRDIIGRAEERDKDSVDLYQFPRFRDALRAVAIGKGNEDISPDRLGWFFRKNKDRTIMVDYNAEMIAVRITQDDTSTQGSKWILKSADPLDIKIYPPALSSIPLRYDPDDVPF